MQLQRLSSSTRVYCANKRQGLPCVAKSGALGDYEAQLAAHLATFTIPADYRDRLRAYVASEPTPGGDPTEQRRRIETRLARIKELYGWGDLGRGEYLTERELLQRDLAALDARATHEAAHLDRLAELLANVARGWNLATQEQRNRLARLLFEEVVIEDGRIVAVKPRPELAGFFALDCQQRATSCKPAEVTGFEPAISALTGQRVRPLHHTSSGEHRIPCPI